MSGKIRVNGTSTNNAGAALLRENKAFEEGMQFRLQGGATAYPITGNPHDGLGNEAEAAWDAGWTLVTAAATANTAFDGKQYGSAASSGGVVVTD